MPLLHGGHSSSGESRAGGPKTRESAPPELAGANRDLVITGADVFVVDAARSWAHAVGVRDGKILCVGTEDEVLDRFRDSAPGSRGRAKSEPERLHLPGRMLLPGFQDAHLHPPFAGQNRLRVSLDHLAGKNEYLDAIAEYAVTHPHEEWIRGGGWAMEYFPGGTPDRADLDRVAPDRPVFLFNRDVHAAWVNTRALEIAGITSATPDPADGRIERYLGTNDPSGTLHEGAAYSFRDRFLPKTPLIEWEAALLNAQDHLMSLGITGWQDAWVIPETLAAYRSLAGSGQLRARVVGALWWDRHRGVEQIDDFISQRAGGSHDRFHPTTVKIMIDGVLENQTGALLAPYHNGCSGHGHAGTGSSGHGHAGSGSNGSGSNGSGSSGTSNHPTSNHNRGLMFVESEVLDAALIQLDALGFQVHMHAIGDRAVRSALDAVEAARNANGWTDNRHHIAHIQIVQPSDALRFRSLGVVANCQTYWAQNEPQMAELTIPFIGPERAAYQYPFGDLERSGAVLAMGSDWGVTTANPLEQVQVAVNRVDPDHPESEPFLPEQRLSLSTAIAAFTAGSAYVNHDSTGGSIRIGNRADFAILDHNIFAPGAMPSDARVEFTLIGGEVVYAKL